MSEVIRTKHIDIFGNDQVCVKASDYDRDTKALEDKARSQHARDSVELRDLCSQRDGFKAELRQAKEERDKLAAEHAELISGMKENMAEVIEDLHAELWRVKEERDSQQRIAIAAMAELAELKAVMAESLDNYRAMLHASEAQVAELQTTLSRYETTAENCDVYREQAKAAPVQAEPVPNVQITGHIDEIDAPVWEFINAEARKIGPATGSVDSYGFARPNGAHPNGGVVVLWNGRKIHAVALTVRDSMNRTQCIRLLNAHPPAAQVATCSNCERCQESLNALDDLTEAQGKANAEPTEAVEVVAWRTNRCEDSTFPRLHKSEAEAHSWVEYCNNGPRITKEPLMTVAQHKRLMANHSADDLNMVKVPRELLARIERYFGGFTCDDPVGVALGDDGLSKLRALLGGAG